jgi:penicillin-binding protein 2
VELPGEASGLVPDRSFYDRKMGKRRWTQGVVLNDIIGQGEVLVTPLQMVRVVAAIANGGWLVTPHLVQAVDGTPTGPHPRRRIPGLTEAMLRRLRRAMVGVVEDDEGTAAGSRAEGFRFAGKTGTAQNPHGEDHAWFVGYAPVDSPEVAIAVLLENAGHGGAVAAPVARDFFMAYFASRGGPMARGEDR